MPAQPQTLRFRAQKAWANLPISKVLPLANLEIASSQLLDILLSGGVFIGENRIDNPDRLVKENDVIRVIVFNPKEIRQRHALEKDVILYNKHGIIAVNKPAGIAVQRTNNPLYPNMQDLVTDLGRRHKLFRQATLCHRLDKETSGVLLLATSELRLQQLMELFQKQKVSKVYWAVCHGAPDEDSWQIHNNLSAINQKTGSVRAVKTGGRPAITDFRLLSHNADRTLSLIECRPQTGRSHQIRVHLADAGFPIVGDRKYGSKEQPAETNLLLHAKEIAFTARLQKKAAAEELSISASVPDTFTTMLPMPTK